MKAGTPQCDEEQQQICANLRNFCCCSSSHCSVPAFKPIFKTRNPEIPAEILENPEITDYPEFLAEIPGFKDSRIINEAKACPNISSMHSISLTLIGEKHEKDRATVFCLRES